MTNNLVSRTMLVTTAIVAVIIGFAVFGQTLWYPYISLDDLQLIYFNPTTKGLTLAHIKAAWTTFDPELYIPLTLMSYQAEFSLVGLSSSVTHGINILLHALNSVLVFYFVTCLTKRRSVGIITGLLFLVHPLNTEAVVWASARKDLLSSFFYLLSLIFYLESKRKSDLFFYSVSLFVFAAALLSKVMVLVLPIHLVLLHILIWNDREYLAISRRLLPFFALSAILGVVALYGKRTIINVLSPLELLTLGMKSTVFYLKMLAWPQRLSILYPQSTAISLRAIEFLVPTLLVLVLIGVAWKLRSSKAFVTFGILWFLTSVAPSWTNAAKAGDVYFGSDRYAYLPSIGVFLLASLGVRWLVDRYRRDLDQCVIFGGLFIVLLTYSTLSASYVKQWENSETLFEHTISLYDSAHAAYFNLGVLKHERGDQEGAIKAFEQSLRIRERSNAHSGIASAFKSLGKMDEAKKQYERAIAVDPDDAEPYLGLGNLFAEEGNIARASQAYDQALSIDPSYTAVYNNYGAMLMQQGSFERAESLLMRAYGINPAFAKTCFNLGKLHQLKRDIPTSTSWFERSHALDSDDIDTLLNLAANAVATRHPTAAIAFLREAQNIDAQHPQIQALVDEMKRLKMVR